MKHTTNQPDPRKKNITLVPSDSSAMEKAHQKALEALPMAKRRWHRATGTRGALGAGDLLVVKHGFPCVGLDMNGATVGSSEYMWVRVLVWRESTLVGLLMNRPILCEGLREGQVVEIREADVFDWAIVRQDGTEIGNFTSRVALAEDRADEVRELLA